MKITELKGAALKTALNEERESEWNNAKIDKKTLIDFAILNQTEYDESGHFIEYGRNR